MKLKNHSGTKKRVKVTKSGKYLIPKAAKNHLLSDKSKQAKGRDKYGMHVADTETGLVAKLLPYAR